MSEVQVRALGSAARREAKEAVTWVTNLRRDAPRTRKGPLERLHDAMPAAVLTSRLDRWADKTKHVAALRELADRIERYERRPVVGVA